MQKKRRWFGVGLVVAGMAMGLFAQHQSGPCGNSFTPQVSTSGASPQIAHAPTISIDTIRWELGNRQSPLTAADAAFIQQQSASYSIDDAFALAVWAAETQDGREAVPGTDNIGNITAATGVSAVGHIFAVYPTWQAGIAAWFALIERLYIQGGHASDLLTFALYYVDGLTPDQATPQQKQDRSGYVATLQSVMASLAAHEQQGTATTSGGSGTGSAGAALTLTSLLPATFSASWAGAGVLAAAASVSIQGCSSSGTPGGNPLVLAAMALAAHLASDGQYFDRWEPNTPAGMLSQQGIVWCTDFVASAYQLATGQAFPSYPDAALWWDGSVGQHPGFVQIPAGPGSFPQAGDIVVLRDGSAGHVAIIVGVQLPEQNQAGFALVAQGHATAALEKWTLAPDGSLSPPWKYPTQIPGYIRVPALAGASVAH